jgi:WXXGXW repeat (2 copies)
MLKNWRRSVLPALLLLVLPVMSMAQVGINISVNLAPPELPVYEQPPIPDEGYLWIPGYWAWGGDEQDYYWVPGTWVLAPQPGFLWTPGYWGSNGGAFVWNEGYWGTRVGFYGGVNYGYGYGGRGFEGGYWQGGHLFYNRSVVNVGTTNITNVYNKTVINNVTVTRTSYNGGSGGVRAQPTAGESAAAHAQHLPPTTVQQQHLQVARSNPALRASANHGNPPIAATAKPGVLSGAGVVAAKSGGKVSEEPAAHKTAPVEKAAPVEHKTAPVEKAAPVEHKTAPVEKAAPVEHKTAPVEHKAAPVEHKTAPVERKVEPEHP